MSSEEFTEYNLPANAYTTFDATSIRDLLISKLIDDDVYTDQLFEGSNISSLIDVLSYTYHLLLFYLNNTASESMFSTAEIYENINRIVKLLNYNPTGALTSTVSFESSAPEGALPNTSYTIPRYTFLSIGSIKYSFVKDIEFNGNLVSEIGDNNLLYEGMYKEQTFSATGEDYEIITLNSPETGFIDFNNIDIYVSRESTSGYLEFKSTSSLFLHSPVESVYEKRLNESSDIEVKFGNNITGLKLQKGDTVTVIYLNSTGLDGTISPNALNASGKTLYLTPTFLSIRASSPITYMSVTDFRKINFNNPAGSISPSSKESVEDIKLNAVQSFKSQSKLSTAKDYEVFIQTRFGELVSDVSVMSNANFIDTYIEYIDKVTTSTSTAFESRLLYNHAQFSTSTTFNNVYAFVKPRIEKKTSNNISVSFLSNSQKQIITNSTEMYKSITTNLILVDPVYMAVDFGIQLPGETLSENNIGKTQLIITKDPLSLKNTSGIQLAVLNVFKEAFDISAASLGSDINISNLVESIASIEGVQSFKLSRVDEAYTFNGLSLLAWNPVYPESDINIISQNITLEGFKAPYIFNSEKLYNNIIVN